MFFNRSKGLLQLHGCIVCLVLPLFFSLYAHVSYAFFDKFNYSEINYPLYWFGSLITGLLSLVYYPGLQEASDLKWYKSLKIANRQTLVLVVVMLTLIVSTKDQAISRIFMVSFIMLSGCLFFILNQYLPSFLSRMVFDVSSVRKCILIGNTQTCIELEDWLLAHENLGLKIVGYIQLDQENVSKKIPCLGNVGSLDFVLSTHNINQVILLETQHSKAWVQQIMNVCEKNAARILIYNPWREYFNQPLIAIQEGAHTFFTFKDEPLENPANRFFKRLLDLCIAIPVVLFILPILCIIVKIFHSLEAQGPLLFKQERIGLNRKPFIIYKFRSMFFKDNNDLETLQASTEDKRIFHFGKIMRKTSLDEFPQFINVLKGEMSLVGPRPHFIGHDKLFTEYIYQYRQRHFAKPGITGLAQVKGYRGEITDLQLLRERTSYDLAYIDDWSIGLDLSILLKTIWCVFFPPKTAY